MRITCYTYLMLKLSLYLFLASDDNKIFAQRTALETCFLSALLCCDLRSDDKILCDIRPTAAKYLLHCRKLLLRVTNWKGSNQNMSHDAIRIWECVKLFFFLSICHHIQTHSRYHSNTIHKNDFLFSYVLCKTPPLGWAVHLRLVFIVENTDDARHKKARNVTYIHASFLIYTLYTVAKELAKECVWRKKYVSV